MGQTAVEKILSRVCGRAVRAGQIVHPAAELVTVHDWYVTHVGQAMEEFGVQRFFAPERVAFFTDHEPLAVSKAAAIRQQSARSIAKRFGVRHFFDVGRGGLGHIHGIEAGLARPGLFASGYDTHITSYGAIGCFATAVVNEVSELLACGSVWLRAPRTVRIELHGALQRGVFARDLAQYVISSIDPDLLDDAVVEFAGPLAGQLSIDQRLVLVNTPMEVGARTAFFGFDETIRRYCAANRIDCSLAVVTDDDAEIAATVAIDVGSVAPQIAAPPRPELAGPVERYIGTPFTHAFIGSCANGMLEDLLQAAAILNGRTIHEDVRLFITPATPDIGRRAAEAGAMETFLAAGAVITAAGCGPCAGGRIAPVAGEEVSLNTGTRNDFGRLGAKDARIFLASSATVAASALTGRIEDPRDYV